MTSMRPAPAGGPYTALIPGMFMAFRSFHSEAVRLTAMIMWVSVTGLPTVVDHRMGLSR